MLNPGHTDHRGRRSFIRSVFFGVTLCFASMASPCDRQSLRVEQGSIQAKNIKALLQEQRITLPTLRAIRVNGVSLNIAEVHLEETQAIRLIERAQALAIDHGDWRVATDQVDRLIVSYWTGARLEVLSLRRADFGRGCVANYSRQDLRRSVHRTPVSPLPLPKSFTPLSVVEEQSAEGRMQLFVFSFAGSATRARDEFAGVIGKSDWRRHTDRQQESPNESLHCQSPSCMHQRKMADGAVHGVWFARRGADQLRATVVAGRSHTRLILQVAKAR